MNILYISTINSYPPYKGEQVHVYYTLSKFIKLGHNVFALEHENHPKVNTISECEILKILPKIDVVYVRQNIENDLDWTADLKKYSNNIVLIWEINGPHFELIYFYYLYYLNNIGILKKILKYSFYFKKKLEVEKFWYNKKKKAKYIDGIITVSDVLANYLKSHFRVPIKVVTNGAEPRWSFMPYKGALNVLVSGGSVPWIDWDTPVKLAQICLNKRLNIHFHFVGKSVDNAPPNITCYGRLSHFELSKIIQKCHVCLVLYNDFSWSPIGFYNSPLKLFEYMAHGKVVIATDLGQISSIIKNEVDGFLVRPKDVQSIYNLLSLLQCNSSLLYKLSKNAYEKIRSQYTWELKVKEYIDFILSLRK